MDYRPSSLRSLRSPEEKTKAKMAWRIALGLWLVIATYRSAIKLGPQDGRIDGMMVHVAVFSIGMWLIWTKPGTTRRLLRVKKLLHLARAVLHGDC
jgi:hypothetical protein